MVSTAVKYIFMNRSRYRHMVAEIAGSPASSTSRCEPKIMKNDYNIIDVPQRQHTGPDDPNFKTRFKKND